MPGLAAARGDETKAESPAIEVDVEVARSAPRSEIVELSGELEPVRRTWVAAEIAGTIVEVPAKEYAPIAQGDLLVRLDDALPRAELIRAQASHALARSELERQERLGSRSVASQATLDAAKAEERRSYAALLEARTRLGHTRIASPFDGLVNALDLDPGAYVQPGTPIAEVLDTSMLEVTVLVGDRQVGSIAVDDRADVRVDALGNRDFTGRVVRVARAPREGTGRYPVVVALEPSAGAEASSAPVPRAGMLAQVRLEVGTAPAIRLPTTAVKTEFELDYVFVLDAQDRVSSVRVSTRPVPFRPDRVEITEGLSDGDRVAVTVVSQLRPGLRVVPR